VTNSCLGFCTVADWLNPLNSADVADVKYPPLNATLRVPPFCVTLSGAELIKVGGTRATGTSTALEVELLPDAPCCATSRKSVPVPDEVLAASRSDAISRALRTFGEMKPVRTGEPFARTMLLERKLVPYR
jgi:hypothetical protein